jgi:hypothetical protein
MYFNIVKILLPVIVKKEILDLEKFNCDSLFVKKKVEPYT